MSNQPNITYENIYCLLPKEYLIKLISEKDAIIIQLSSDLINLKTQNEELKKDKQIFYDLMEENKKLH